MDVIRTYRFREGYLLSDIDPDDALLDPKTERTMAFDQLAVGFASLSPEFITKKTALLERGESFLIDGRVGDDPVSIGGRLEDDGALTLSIGPGEGKSGRQVVETETIDALRAELADLRASLDVGAAPMWREDGSNAVIWANSAYVDLVQRLRDGQAPGWPLPRIFAPDLESEISDGTVRRCVLELPDRDGANWYDVTRDQLPDGSRFYVAQPSDRLVRAETDLRDFVQTLTKTFAALPIGLAVFDRRRELVTFNPALVALTAAEPAFLTSRPDLRAFLDRLRDLQRIPEPRDYQSWRDEITRLETGAQDGTFHELWDLPEGKSFRVMGRPHPDGAIAFMFEDISAEVDLTRKFRAELDLLQATLDATPSAIAVFDAAGAMVCANAGYARLWGDDPATAADMPSLTKASALWASRCKPTRLWGEVRQFISHEVERTPWSEEIQHIDGTPILVRMSPVRGRYSVVQFAPKGAAWDDPLSGLNPDQGTAMAPATARQTLKSAAKAASA